MKATTDYIEVAEKLYKYVNPTSKMNCPNSVYITTEKWYNEWLNTDTDLNFAGSAIFSHFHLY